jgi:hypothetical protein
MVYESKKEENLRKDRERGKLKYWGGGRVSLFRCYLSITNPAYSDLNLNSSVRGKTLINLDDWILNLN